VGVAGLAIVVRLVPLLLGGGLESYGRYDDGVYFAASDALTFGRVPYRDFILLHPPGLMLLLTPFALLGRLTSDPVGMAVGRLFFIGVGAVNTMLVAGLVRRWGLPAAIAAGTLYACWLPAVYNEQSTMLEPLGSTALLIALALLVKRARPPSPRAELVAGAALGLACALKIWYVAPWAVVVLSLIAARRWRSVMRLVGSGSVALAIVMVPFFALAPHQMFTMVVRDQLLRSDHSSSRLSRLASILGVRALLRGNHLGLLVATGVLAVALVLAASACWYDRQARLIVSVLVGNLIVLLAGPIYHWYYAALTAAPAALTFGIGLHRLTTSARPRLHVGPVLATTVLGVWLIVVAVLGVDVTLRPQGTTFPRAQFAAAAPAGCVASDDPGALIEMNRLSEDFRQHCRVLIDVTGITHDSLRRVVNGKAVGRLDNTAFQQYLHDYLVSSRSFFLAREVGEPLPTHFRQLLRRQPLLAHADGLDLRRGDG
jgi:hypothetical protein